MTAWSFTRWMRCVCLKFPAESFDLVNERFGVGWLRTWSGSNSCRSASACPARRLIRVTEFNVIVESTSPALTHLVNSRQRHSTEQGISLPGSDGVTKGTRASVAPAGIRHVQTRAHVLEHRASTPEGQLFG